MIDCFIKLCHHCIGWVPPVWAPHPDQRAATGDKLILFQHNSWRLALHTTFKSVQHIARGTDNIANSSKGVSVSYGHQDAMVGPNQVSRSSDASICHRPCFSASYREASTNRFGFFEFFQAGGNYLACISVKKDHPNRSGEASFSIGYFYLSKVKKTISGPRWCLILKPERKCCSSAISHQSPLWVSFFWRPRKHFQTLSLPAGRGSFPRNITSSPRGDNRGEAAVKQSR